MKSLEEMADEVYRWTLAKGWEPDPERTFGDTCSLMHSEISEALEAFREWGLDDATADYQILNEAFPGTLPKPEGVGSEYADLLIRLLHYAKVYDIDLRFEFERKMAYNWTREHRHGGKRL